MILQLVIAIIITILGFTIFFIAKKYEKYHPDIKNPKAG